MTVINNMWLRKGVKFWPILYIRRLDGYKYTTFTFDSPVAYGLRYYYSVANSLFMMSIAMSISFARRRESVLMQLFQLVMLKLTSHANRNNTNVYITIAAGWLGSLVVKALDSRLDGRELDSRPLHAASTGMGNRLRAGKPPQYFTKPPRPTQPPTLSERGNEYQPRCGDALRLWCKGRCGSFHLWINVWVAGETSLTCHTWAARNKAVYK